MRFKEVVFVHNVINDDRFCNTQSIKSVISLPIFQGKDMLGILYLVGLEFFFGPSVPCLSRGVIGFLYFYFIATISRRTIIVILS